ncbi:MAG: ketoacyl-ACP synthase III [Paludibacteraceae bacterium]|nr:ketoacyl-ACP synthase III [Paludibacteraceae bacterium]
MAFLEIKNVRITGLATAVPKNVISIDNKGYDEEYIERFIDQTGIAERRGSNELTSSDLLVMAAERLMEDLHWEKESIDAILCVTNTPDYTLPINACILQDRLGLNRECYAQDISLGCSGWVCGLNVLSALLRDGKNKRGLLLTGDSKNTWGPGNNALLFGSAGCATALEYDPNSDGFKFEFGTDGSGYDAIIMPKSGMRNMKLDENSYKEFIDSFKEPNTVPDLKPIDIFSFSISHAPKSINALCEHFGLDYKACDYLVLHQANKKINQHIQKKMKMEPERTPSSLRHFGNTMAASIPITITTELKGKVENKKTNFICCGFGVGLSWGSVAFSTENLVISDMIEVDDNQFENLKWV